MMTPVNQERAKHLHFTHLLKTVCMSPPRTEKKHRSISECLAVIFVRYVICVLALKKTKKIEMD
jgi:hypothetical protein